LGISTLYLNKVKTALSCRAQVIKNSPKCNASNIKHTPHNRKINEHGDLVVSKICQEQKRLNADEIELLIEGYSNGDSIYKLAKRFDCGKTTVSSILKRHDIVVSNRVAQKKLDIEDVIAKYNDMLSSQEIAEEYGVSPNVVLRCLRENGVKVRGRWDY
jgi:DNA invertase Pin-like site-specific DNA recombinase